MSSGTNYPTTVINPKLERWTDNQRERDAEPMEPKSVRLDPSPHFHEWPLENLENPADRDALTTTHDNNR